MKLFAVFFALFVSGVEPQAPQTSDPNRIESIQVLNNRRIPSDTIKYNIQAKPGDTFNLAVIQRDIRALYAMGYFEDIQVEEEAGETGRILTYRVVEKPTVRAIDYEGLKSVTQSDVLQRFRELRVGLSIETAYDPSRIKRAQNEILNLLAEKGRQNATIEIETYEIPPNAIGVAFVIDEGPKIKIEKIEIVGNEVFSDGKVKGAMQLIKEAGAITGLTNKDVFHDLKLADDITRIQLFYRENGYVRVNVLEPVIEVRRHKVARTLPFIKLPFPWGIPLPFWKKEVDRFFITITVEEGDQYEIGQVSVEGNQEFTDAQILFVLGLIPGEIYNETFLREGFEALTTLYGERGYINFTPVPVHTFDDVNKVVDLEISIDEDRRFLVNRIAFRGNTTTRDKVIRREILLQEGSVFSSRLWDTSLLRLNQLGFFDELTAENSQIRPHPTLPEVDITLDVAEQGRQSIGFNGGVSGIGGSFLGMNYSTNNFLGFGERLSIDIQGGTRMSNFVFSFTEPYLMDRPISTGFSIFKNEYQYDQARDVFGLDPENLPEGLGLEDRLNYEQKSVGFNVFTSYPFRGFQRLGATFQFSNSSTDAVNPATAAFFENVKQSEEERFIEQGSFSSFRSRSIVPSYTYSTVSNPYAPRGGQSLTASFEFTGGVLGGNVNYMRPVFEYTFFKAMNYLKPSLFGRNVLAVRFRGSHIRGFNDTAVPFYQRSFMGGDFDIRGFEFNSIGPVAFVERTLNDRFTGQPIPQDDIVYIGGDTTAVLNIEYRIPLIQDAATVTLAPFLDIGNSWVTQKEQLTREVVQADGSVTVERVQFLPGTNSGVRISTGVELGLLMPIINAPFRLIFAYNPLRIDQLFAGPVTGRLFQIRTDRRAIKFTVGKTF